MKQFKIFINISFVFFLFGQTGAGCVSFETINAPEFRNVAYPVISPAEYPIRPDQTPPSDDYKIRDRAAKQIRIVPVFRFPGENILPASVQSAQRAAFLRNLSAAKAYIIHARPDLNISAETIRNSEVSAFLKKENADAVLEFSMRPSAPQAAGSEGTEPYTLTLTLFDPVTGKAAAIMERNAVYIPAKNRQGQADFYQSPDGIVFFQERHFPRIKADPLPVVTLQEFIKKSVTGKADIYASAPDAVLTIKDADGKQIFNGRGPLTGHILDEGLYTVEARRPGRSVLSALLRVRAFESSSVFITFPDDPDQTFFSAHSIPSGQRLALDGVIQGETPWFRAAFQPGVYETELSSKDSSGRYIVTYKGRTEVFQGSRNDIIFAEKASFHFKEPVTSDLEKDFRSFWIPSSAGDVKPVFGPNGLSVASGIKKDWSGFVSRRLPHTSFRAEFLLPAVTAPHRVGLLSGPESLILERTKEGDVYTALIKGKQSAPALSRSVLKKNVKPDSSVKAVFDYSAGDNMLQVTIGGLEVYKGGFRSDGRLRLLAEIADSQNQEILMHGFIYTRKAE